MKKISFLAVLLVPFTFLMGCATSGRNHQNADINSLNARVNALEGQLSAKDQEISSLQSKMNDERLAREASESALRNAENEKLALAKQAASASSVSKSAVAGSEYLK